VSFAQGPTVRQEPQLRQNSPASTDPADTYVDQQAETELQTGTALTSHGQFNQAIPHLLAARGRVANEYAADFNLALCYVATQQPTKAIPLLIGLRNAGHDNAAIENLLAQAYVGDSQDEKAFNSLQRAAIFAPENEKLYMFVADACMGKQSYKAGMQVVELGLKHLPNSARLHFERGMFLTLTDRFDDARSDFNLAKQLAPDSDISFIAGAEEAMFDGNVTEAIQVSREGIGKGHDNFMLLTLLGEALLRSGVAPGQKEFEEARQALERAVAERPSYPSAQLALGKLYLLGGQTTDAVAHLEAAQAMNPGNPAVYSNLAAAYRKLGDTNKAEESLSMLAKLNQAQAEKIRTAPGETKAGYGGPSQQMGR
jgi:tetratricopeptide (TPR) repeat protein